MSKFVVATSVFVLVLCAFAQDSSFQRANVDRELGFSPAPIRPISRGPMENQIPPSYCKPCLFYAGDWDSNASDANGLANEKDTIISTGAAVYTPFIVRKGKTWTVTGLFTANIMTGANVLDPPEIPYEVRKGIPKTGGNGGKLVCQGRKTGDLVQMKQDWFGYPVFFTKVENIKGCRLSAGKYWVSVVPYCTNTNNNQCEDNYRAYEANDDGAMANRYGPLEPANDSFFNSVYFGAVWQPSSEQQTSSRFSAGVEGRQR